MFVKPANLGIERRHLEGEGRAPSLARRDRPRRRVRPQDRRRGGRAERARDRVRGARQRRRPRRRCPARSSRRASSTTTRRSTSTTARRADHPGAARPATQRPRSGGCRSRRSRPIDCAGMARVDFLLGRATRRSCRERGQHDSRLHDDQHVLEAVGGQRRRLPGAARSARSRSRSSGTPRSSSCAPASHESSAGARAVVVLAGAGAADPCTPSRPGRARFRGDGRPRRAPTTSSSTRASTRSTPSCARACGPAPPEACHVLDATALWWRILLDPGQPRARRRVLDARSIAAIAATEAWTERAAATMPRRGSTSAARTRARVQWRVLRDERLAAARDGKRIKDALERALELDPRSTTRTSASACTSTTPTSRRRRRRSCASCCCCPAAIARRGWRQMLRARDHGRAAAGRGRLPAARHLSLVRAAARPRRSQLLAARCTQRYPGNPLFLQRIAEIAGRLPPRPDAPASAGGSSS